MDMRIAVSEDPRLSGKPLKGELGVFWRYRVGDYRILCEIRDDELIILAATIGHRREVYD
jgi:mRNA interferase RelE/StbE